MLIFGRQCEDASPKFLSLQADVGWGYQLRHGACPESHSDCK
jgi:hypothetical protein